MDSEDNTWEDTSRAMARKLSINSVRCLDNIRFLLLHEESPLWSAQAKDEPHKSLVIMTS